MLLWQKGFSQYSTSIKQNSLPTVINSFESFVKLVQKWPNILPNWTDQVLLNDHSANNVDNPERSSGIPRANRRYAFIIDPKNVWVLLVFTQFIVANVPIIPHCPDDEDSTQREITSQTD